jgi:hypothetical protein
VSVISWCAGIVPKAEHRRRCFIGIVSVFAGAIAGCTQLSGHVTCDGVRRVHLGDSEAAVRRQFGEPLKTISGHFARTGLARDEQMLVYHGDYSTILIQAFFYQDSLVSLSIARKFPLLAAERLYVLDESLAVETPMFRRIFNCQ